MILYVSLGISIAGATFTFSLALLENDDGALDLFLFGKGVETLARMIERLESRRSEL